ncbi:hypothetical protein CAOG_010082 [Capsaspora owczarzaki ATCC 30864]|uniref:Uncharacterized protein n=1 Tax=Capsaspora owczarzaki (strain ATCC 30864) TaxID=595528 RepID=A0A0D2X537_CAPO3|nr:hypothetical protein CAOG_010082 [Capsaspora owczarzaki ATCC 30864]
MFALAGRVSRQAVTLVPRLPRHCASASRPSAAAALALTHPYALTRPQSIRNSTSSSTSTSSTDKKAQQKAQDDAAERDLSLPVLFPNNQGTLQNIARLAAAFVVFWGVWMADYGDHEHVFSPIRRWTDELLDQFRQVSLEEKLAAQQRAKEQIEQLKQQQQAQPTSLKPASE